MPDFVHELVHNRTRRGFSTPAWQARLLDAINRGIMPPIEPSDDPWTTVVYPRNEDLGVQ